MKRTVHKIPGLTLIDHEISAPLDYSRPDGAQIKCFAREVVASGKETASLPAVVFLQGGPGFGAPRPYSRSSWLGRLLREYRVVMLDQRGTGRSSPITTRGLLRLGPAEAQVEHLRHFRADAIVQDAERMRRALYKDRPWTLLGQSYGGFCAARYQFAAPEGLDRILVTGGIPPIGVSVDDVYRATYKRVLDRNRRYYARYPGDEAMIHRIMDHLIKKPVSLPGGGTLSPRRFQQLGSRLGMSDGFESMHYLVEDPFDGEALSFAFLRAVESAHSFETNPIYAILHESIYCEGSASSWSAHRVRPEFPEFEVRPDQPVFLTGEMVYPWMFEDYAELRPLQPAAELLAKVDDWPALYGERAEEVPGAAAVYHDDMYVERAFSEAAAARLPGLRLWVTNEYDHNGLRMDGSRIVDRLLRMARGEL